MSARWYDSKEDALEFARVQYFVSQRLPDTKSWIVDDREIIYIPLDEPKSFSSLSPRVLSSAVALPE